MTHVHWPQVGETLRDLVERHHLQKWARPADRDLSLRGLLDCWLDVVRAVELHPDSVLALGVLTPSSIRIGRQGETLLNLEGPAAFNATRSENEERTSARTRSGSPPEELMALVFASPEAIAHVGEAAGETPHRTSNVYALGALLYYILTGRAPSVSRDRETLLKQIEAGDFPPPKQVNPSAPRELQAVCLKAMRREPAQRYQDPVELMLDVKRWLAGQKVNAYAESLWGGVLRKVRHHPAAWVWLAAALSLATAFLVILAVVLEWERRDAERDKRIALMNRAQARVAQLASAEELTKTRLMLYYNQLRSTQREWRTGQIQIARETLASCRPELRDWEHDYLYTLITKDDSPDADVSAAVIKTPYEIRSLVVRPDGSICYSGAPGLAVDCWDSASGQLASTWAAERPPMGEQPALAISPDGATLLSSGTGGALYVWDAVSGDLTMTLRAPGGDVCSLAFAEDGESFVTCGVDGAVTLWNTSPFRPIWSHQLHAGPCTAALAPDGLRGASGGSNGLVKVWGAETGQIQRELSGQGGAVRALAFSHDGYWVAGGKADGAVAVWDAESGHQEHRLTGHHGSANAIVFSDDGRRVFSGGEDATIVIWNMLTGDRVLSLSGHSAAVTVLRLADEDRRLFSGSADDTVRIWDASQTESRP